MNECLFDECSNTMPFDNQFKKFGRVRWQEQHPRIQSPKTFICGNVGNLLNGNKSSYNGLELSFMFCNCEMLCWESFHFTQTH